MADSPTGKRQNDLSLVRVTSSNLMFGCMIGTVEGGENDGMTVTVSLVAHRRQRLLGGWPRVGDVVGCEHIYHSIYLAHVLMLQEDLTAQCMLRRFLPTDLTEEYFDIRRPLFRVEGW